MTAQNKQDWARTLLQAAVFLIGIGAGWVKIETRLTSIETTLVQREQSLQSVAAAVGGMEAIRIDLRLIDLRLTRLEEETKKEK